MPAPDAEDRAERDDRERVKMTENVETIPEATGMGETDVLDDILGEAGEAPPVPESQPAAEEAQPENTETAVPDPEAEPQPEEPKEPEVERTVPLKTFLDMRDENKEYKARLSQLERALAESRKPNVQQPQSSDLFDDPEGYAKNSLSMQDEFNSLKGQVQEQKMAFVEMSLAYAQEKMGDQVFNDAYEAAKNDARASLFILNSPNPGGALIEYHNQRQRQQILDRIPEGKSLEDWIREEAMKLPAQQPVQQPDKPKIAAPTPSLAAAKGSGTGAMTPVLSDDPLDDLLK